MARASRYDKVRENILGLLKEAEERHGRPPSVRELASATGVSGSTMHSYLHRLKSEGVVEWEPRQHRSLRRRPGSLPSGPPVP